MKINVQLKNGEIKRFTSWKDLLEANLEGKWKKLVAIKKATN